MKSSRIKGIVILILALVNVFLLALLLVQRGQERRAYERTCRELDALCLAAGVSIDASALPRESAPAALDLSRDSAAEQALADLLLGPTRAADAGGGIYRYYNGSGSAVFRSSGRLEAACACPVDDIDAFCASVFSAIGYAETHRTLADGTGSVTAVCRLGTLDVFNAALTLRFEGGSLVGAEGSFLSVSAASPAADSAGLDAVSAVVRFLDYRTASGVICTAIPSVRRGFLLQSTASAPLHLSGVWCVTTDAAGYYVNSSTGEVLRP